MMLPGSGSDAYARKSDSRSIIVPPPIRGGGWMEHLLCCCDCEWGIRRCVDDAPYGFTTADLEIY